MNITPESIEEWRLNLKERDEQTAALLKLAEGHEVPRECVIALLRIREAYHRFAIGLAELEKQMSGASVH